MEDNENEVSQTDSAMMSDSRVHSTPVSTKESSKSDNDTMSFLCNMVRSINEKMNDSQKHFHELRG